jgi:UDP-N-acetylglucosamine 2-epimerase (non-hydrolysing)
VASVLCVVGARPNFVKIAPIARALRARALPHVLLHTGQHHDAALSQRFFDELAIPPPDRNLGVEGGSHGEQTARIMLAFEPVLEEEKPGSVVVVGDVNSTIACALVAQKRGVPVVHVEAGLRSFDRTMPEETNRVLTDQLAELCLTPSPDADRNLLREGIASHRIERVGNVMIDTLIHELPSVRSAAVRARFELPREGYALATLHRPSNVDDPTRLAELLGALAEISAELPILMPLHPRTRRRVEELGLVHRVPLRGLRLVPPLGYRDTLALVAEARLVLTDSGGLQEETTALRVPCLTLRDSTERPITVEVGTNLLVGTDPARIVPAARRILRDGARRSRIPDLWDGCTAGRIVDAMLARRLV